MALPWDMDTSNEKAWETEWTRYLTAAKVEDSALCGAVHLCTVVARASGAGERREQAGSHQGGVGHVDVPWRQVDSCN